MRRLFYIFLFFVCSIPAIAQDSLAHWPKPNEFILVTQETQLLNLEEMVDSLKFSELAMEIDGKVILRILFDEKGKRVRHIVVKDPHPLLTKVFTDQIHLLRAKPGEIDGRAVSTWVTIPFQPHFRY